MFSDRIEISNAGVSLVSRERFFKRILKTNQENIQVIFRFGRKILFDGHLTA